MLPSPRHFEQAAQVVGPETVREAFVCGRDADAHLAKIDQYVRAGFDEVYVANTGPHRPAPARTGRACSTCTSTRSCPGSGEPAGPGDPAATGGNTHVAGRAGTVSPPAGPGTTGHR